MDRIPNDKYTDVYWYCNYHYYTIKVRYIGKIHNIDIYTNQIKNKNLCNNKNKCRPVFCGIKQYIKTINNDYKIILDSTKHYNRDKQYIFDTIIPIIYY